MKKFSVFLVSFLVLFSLSSCDLKFSDPNVTINTIEDEGTNIIQVQNEITKTIAKVSRYCVGIYAASGQTASIGSGVIYRINDLETREAATAETKTAICYVVTNEHVIASDGASNMKYKVYLGQDKYYPADIVGSDATNDIAVLTFQINLGDDTVLYTDFSDIYGADMTVPAAGSYAIAIGCPLTLDNFNYPTIGLVGNVTLNTITHSALINPGNSGGGLFDTSGRLIGLNVRKSTVITETDSNGNESIVPIEGLGEAIPVWTLKSVINDIESLNKVVVRPTLGISAFNANASLVDEHREYLPNIINQGVVVKSVEFNSNANKLKGTDANGSTYQGLLINDVIAKVNDEEITRSDELGYYLSTSRIGDALELLVYRKVNSEWVAITFKGKLA